MTYCKPLCTASLCLVLLLAAGCAKPTVQIDSLGEAHLEETYLIQPGQANVRPDDLYFVEYKRHLARLLSNLGYQVTDDTKQATAAVLLSYEARQTTVYNGSSGTRVGIGMGTGTGGYYRDWDDDFVSTGSFFGLGLGFPIGDDSSPSSSWHYVVVLDAVAFDGKGAAAKGQGEVKSLWKTTIVSDGSDGNMRAVFPAMLDAARSYIGRDSNGQVTVEIPSK